MWRLALASLVSLGACAALLGSAQARRFEARLTTREVESALRAQGFRIDLVAPVPGSSLRFNSGIFLKAQPQLADQVEIEIWPTAAAAAEQIARDKAMHVNPPGHPLGYRVGVTHYIQVCNVFVNGPTSLFANTPNLTDAAKRQLNQALTMIYGYEGRIAKALRQRCPQTA